VLVVGSGSSGVQITSLLAESHRFETIHLAVSDVLVLPRHVLGVPIHRLVHAFGLFDIPARSGLGRRMYAGPEPRGDPIRRPHPKDLNRLYGVKLHGRLEAVDSEVFQFADGEVLPAEDMTVIWCTGYRGDYEMLADMEGVACAISTRSPLMTSTEWPPMPTTSPNGSEPD
jgi:cation diffusion facilitator CzcD-associated flavoprotein CzcO